MKKLMWKMPEWFHNFVDCVFGRVLVSYRDDDGVVFDLKWERTKDYRKRMKEK